MAKIIIGIHGMGNKPPRETLKTWWKTPIIESLARIDKPKKKINFELFYWTHYIHPVPLDPEIKDKKNPLYIAQPYFPIPENIVDQKPSKLREKVLDYLNRQMDKIFLNDDFTINYASINDFVIRHFFNDFEAYYNGFCEEQGEQCRIRTAICSDLAALLKKHRRKKILLIAHSMGTIIAYEVLTQYSTNVPIHTLVTLGSPLGMPVIKSKIMSEALKQHPQKIEFKTPENVISKWYNLSDLKDRIAFNYKLSDDFTENSRQVLPTDKIVVNHYEFMGEKNPHKSYGYLSTPELSEIVSQFLGVKRFSPFAWIKKAKSVIGAIRSRPS